MPEYRRRYADGGTFFFTIVTHFRRGLFWSELARQDLDRAIRSVQSEYRFEMLATVLLPEHWHCLWTLPEGDVDYSNRVGLIKMGFTKLWLSGGGEEREVSAARR